MNTREMAEGYRMSHWSEKMRERQELGMSIKAYCAQQCNFINTAFNGYFSLSFFRPKALLKT